MSIPTVAAQIETWTVEDWTKFKGLYEKVPALPSPAAAIPAPLLNNPVNSKAVLPNFPKFSGNFDELDDYFGKLLNILEVYPKHFHSDAAFITYATGLWDAPAAVEVINDMYNLDATLEEKNATKNLTLFKDYITKYFMPKNYLKVLLREYHDFSMDTALLPTVKAFNRKFNALVRKLGKANDKDLFYVWLGKLTINCQTQITTIYQTLSPAFGTDLLKAQEWLVSLVDKDTLGNVTPLVGVDLPPTIPVQNSSVPYAAHSTPLQRTSSDNADMMDLNVIATRMNPYGYAYPGFAFPPMAYPGFSGYGPFMPPPHPPIPAVLPPKDGRTKSTWGAGTLDANGNHVRVAGASGRCSSAELDFRKIHNLCNYCGAGTHLVAQCSLKPTRFHKG